MSRMLCTLDIILFGIRECIAEKKISKKYNDVNVLRDGALDDDKYR